MQYEECCQSQGGWVAVVVIVIIILILLFIISSQRKTDTTTPAEPAPVPTHDFGYAYHDVDSGAIVPFEPLEFNSQIAAPNTQFVYDQANSSYTLPPGSYKMAWTANIVDTAGVSDEVGFGISTTIAAPNLGVYPAPVFLEGSIFQSRLQADANNAHRMAGHYCATFDTETEIQVREALGTTGLVLGTASVAGLDHAKQSFSVTRLDDTVAL